jgi:hypothetical protein
MLIEIGLGVVGALALIHEYSVRKNATYRTWRMITNSLEQFHDWEYVNDSNACKHNKTGMTLRNHTNADGFKSVQFYTGKFFPNIWPVPDRFERRIMIAIDKRKAIVGERMFNA